MDAGLIVNCNVGNQSSKYKQTLEKLQ